MDFPHPDLILQLSLSSSSLAGTDPMPRPEHLPAHSPPFCSLGFSSSQLLLPSLKTPLWRTCFLRGYTEFAAICRAQCLTWWATTLHKLPGSPSLPQPGAGAGLPGPEQSTVPPRRSEVLLPAQAPRCTPESAARALRCLRKLPRESVTKKPHPYI